MRWEPAGWFLSRDFLAAGEIAVFSMRRRLTKG